MSKRKSACNGNHEYEEFHGGGCKLFCCVSVAASVESGLDICSSWENSAKQSCIYCKIRAEANQNPGAIQIPDITGLSKKSYPTKTERDRLIYVAASASPHDSGFANFTTEEKGAVRTVSEMARAALSPTNPNQDLSSIYFSLALQRAEKHMDDKHAQDFDADPITGGQDTQGWTVGNVSQRGSIVTVVYETSPGYIKAIEYKFVKEAGRWKVDDIIYPSEGYRSKKLSFRQFMIDPVVETPPPK